MRTFPGRSQRLTRSHASPCAPGRARLCIARACRLHDEGVDLKRRPPKSRPAAPHRRHRSPIEDATRRDSAVHVSLSSDSPVKQPGTGRSHPPVSRRAVEARDLRLGSEAWSPISVRSFEDAPSHRGGGVPYLCYIGFQPPACQHLGGGKSTLPVPRGNSRLHKQYRGLRARGKARPRRTAATFLRPHGRRSGRCHFGGNYVGGPRSGRTASPND